MGLYPWRCNTCNSRQMLRVREDQQRKPDHGWMG
jgi:DNA-directed RNA polymerase subunit RPC12/RpoP